MSGYAVLEITDGTTTVNLIDPHTGFFVTDWKPSVAGPKGDGVWQDSPMADNRRMVLKRFGNATETLTLQVQNWCPDSLIENTQNLRALLEKATNYWLDDWRNEPVWIKAQGRLEENPRYAVIRDYRTPSDGFPYGEPFWNLLSNAAMDDFPLVLERGHWRSAAPGTGACVEVSAEQDYYLSSVLPLLNADFEVWTVPNVPDFWTVVAGTGAVAMTGIRHTGAFAPGITAGVGANTYIHQAITVVPGNTVYYKFWTRGDGANAGQYGIYDVTNAAYILAVATTGVTGAVYAIISGSFVVPAGCVSARIEFWCPVALAGISYFDAAELWLSYSGTDTFGRIATCTDEVFIANKHNQAQLTHVYYYDLVDGPIGDFYSANLIGAALPFTFLPAVPAAGDMVYFGIDTSVPGAGPFSNIIFDIGTAQAALTGAWEYLSAGATWRAFDVVPPFIKLVDNTADFGVTGVCSVVFSQFEPDNTNAMAAGTVNGVTGYWVRWRCTVGAAAAPTQQNRDIYTVVTPHIDIAVDEIGGDLPAPIQLYLTQHGKGFDYINNYHRLLVASRSVSRGDDFSPYINLGGAQNNAAISIAMVAGATSTTMAHLYTPGPTGYVVRYQPAGAEAVADKFDVTISNVLSSQYYGSFRALLLFQVATNTWGTLTTRLKADYGYPTDYWTQVYQSDNVLVSSSAYETVYVADLGKLSWPDFLRDTTAANMRLRIGLGATVAATFYMYSLVLWPVDEISVDMLSPDRLMYPVYSYEKLAVDSLTAKDSPVVDAYTYYIPLGRKAIQWNVIGGGFTVLPNTAQHIYVMNMYNRTTATNVWNQEPFSLLSIQMFDTQHYLSMRGSR